jgi:hypothetical protein
VARAKKRKRAAPEIDVASKIMSVDEASEHIKILVYARNKKGKTRFAASAPSVLIVDINERGTLSAKGSGAKVIQVSSWAEIDAVYWFLARGDHPYKSVALDTLTAMNAVCLSRVLREGHKRDPDKDPKVARRQDWGTTASLMREMLLRYRNLPMHVIFTAQERKEGDPEEGEPIEILPDLPAGSRGAALGAVDLVGRLYRTKKPRSKGNKKKGTEWETRMLVGDHDVYETGSREIVLDRIIRNPTVPKIIEAAKSSKEE